MRVLERTIEHAVVEYARTQLNVRSIKLNLTGHRGWPDRLFFIPGGRPTLIEFKRPGAKPTRLQMEHISYLKARGYDVHTCDDTEIGKALLRTAIVAAAPVHAPRGPVAS